MKKHFYLLILFLISFSNLTFSQQNSGSPEKKWEKIEGLRLEYVLKKLNLSNDVQEKFSPIYKTYQREIGKLMYERKKSREAEKNDAQKKVDNDFYFESKNLEIKKNYKNKFQEILTSEQLNTLYSAERQFKEELINQLHKK